MGTTDPVTRSAPLADRLARLIRVPTISLPVGRDEASFVAFRALPISTSGTSFERIKAALATSYPDALPVPYVMVQASDSRHFVNLSRNIYRFMPFAISASQLHSIHGADENLDISSLGAGVEFYRHLLAGKALAARGSGTTAL